MEQFIKLLIQEATSTIEGLTGSTPAISNTKQGSIADVLTKYPYAATTISFTGDTIGTIAIIDPIDLTTALSDLMLGGNGQSQEEASSDDLDALKEINSNIFGAISTAMNSQKDMPKINFAPQKIEVAATPSAFGAFSEAYEFSFSLNSINSHFIFLASDNFLKLFKSDDASEEHSASSDNSGGEQHLLNPEEIRNIGMLMDVKLTVKVRIGQKKMLLKDVISMDIGSVVELNQLANDPLEVLIDDKVIAKGEVVIVDGNFGIQITDIGTKRERLEQLRG
ncbi:flagellar motor switch protein FliN [Helicobacter sp. CLO-3]|uniref:flagellar motor switch protein FliY n=1 Tax=unclassified Helicobacter TaxID=2593540 RepID=UPI0008048925|nr:MULTISPECIES: flagellar motor switch protein FliY [unclassified Helicobacter]OBV28344.1 flagellar motor switch protein FliN [Helicobacter sp. CLO-3]OHU84517.1 flagellar motor switch protein FliN [Helicobacter sp. CLO-3]